ncbi:MAG TPA: ATP-binding protein [Nitrospirota bacterium]|nr:ATP-binding protein [Nitrospirota bacterium]
MEKLNNIIERLNAGVLLIDPHHRIQWMNKKVVEWFGPLDIGKKRRCYRTMNFSDSFCPICPTGKTIDAGISTRYELFINSKGLSRTFEIIGIPVSAKNGDISMVMELILDVTKKSAEKIKNEELLAQIEKMAAIGQLAAGVAHELNTPLGTIAVIADELKNIIGDSQGSETPVERFMEYLTDMDTEIRRCKIIIEDLLNVSKSGILRKVDTDINELVSRTILLVDKGGSSSSKVTISRDLDNNLPIIKIDPERFRQVIFNVLKNSLEAMADREDGRVNISTGTKGEWLRVSISDNGVGIPEENLKRIFEPFFTTKPVGKGTGLGLFVSYGIMRDLKGDIKLESSTGRGTRVTLLLPVSDEEE